MRKAWWKLVSMNWEAGTLQYYCAVQYLVLWKIHSLTSDSIYEYWKSTVMRDSNIMRIYIHGPRRLYIQYVKGLYTGTAVSIDVAVKLIENVNTTAQKRYRSVQVRTI